MNTTEFLTRVRLMAQLPDADEDFPATQILAEASQCLFERFSQPIVNTRSGYWQYNQTISTVAGQSFYRIPSRAVVQGLELFCLTTPNAATQWYQLAVLTNAQAVPYKDQPASGTPQAFSFESDGIVLYPTPQTAQSLQFRFYLRPGALVAVPTYSGVITSAVTTTQLIVSSPDATPVPWVAGSIVDIRNTDGTCEAVAIDQLVASVADGANIATINLATPLTADQFSRLRADGTQAVMTADTSWVVPLPAEMVSALMSYTAAVILVDRGDAEKAAQLVSRCEAVVKTSVDLMTPRIKTRPWVFKTTNTYLRRNAAGWRRGW